MAGVAIAVLLGVLLWTAFSVFAGDHLLLVTAALAVFGAVFFLASIRSPQSALTALVISLPLVSVGVLEVGWSVRPAQVIVMLILLSWLVAARIDWHRVPLAGWMGIYLVSLVLSAGYALSHGIVSDTVVSQTLALRASAVRPLVQLFTITLSLAVFPISFLLIDSEKRLNLVLKVFLTVTAVIALYGLYQTVAVALGWPLTDITQALRFTDSATTDYGETRYYSGVVTSFAPRSTFAESLHFGAFLAGVLPFCLTCWLGRKQLPVSWHRWPWGILTILLGTALLLTFSRSSWAAAALGTFVVLIGVRRLRVLRTLPLTLVVLYLAFLAFSRLPIFDSSLTPLGLIAKRMSTDTMAADPRWTYFSVLSRTALANPVWGVGLGDFALIGAGELGLQTILSAHGVWMAHWVEGGFLGLLVVLAFFGAIARRLSRALKCARGGRWYYPLLGLCAGTVAMCVQYLTFGDRFEPHFWFIIALAFVIGSLVQTPNIAARVP